MNDKSLLSLSGVAKCFGSHQALIGVDLEVEKGDFVSLLGPSGCGKSTLLAIIAGTLAPDSGEIRISGHSQHGLAPYERDLTMVFQDYALFPHMSVADNVAFGLRMRRGLRGRDAIADKVQEMLALVRLPNLGARYPAELSGGQQQRVAIARALAPEPALLLMDEPLSNLDAKVRERMRAELKDIQRATGVTTIYVTHDQEEALALSDEVVVMSEGRIEQRGTPEEIYDTPASRFVASFVGRANLLDGRMLGTGEDRTFVTERGLRLRCSEDAPDTGTVVLRPERIRLVGEDADGIAARVLHSQFGGAVGYLECATEGEILTVMLPHHPGQPLPVRGEEVRLGVAPDAMQAVQ